MSEWERRERQPKKPRSRLQIRERIMLLGLGFRRNTTTYTCGLIYWVCTLLYRLCKMLQRRKVFPFYIYKPTTIMAFYTHWKEGRKEASKRGSLTMTWFSF
jgi:hypothetical protein